MEHEDLRPKLKRNCPHCNRLVSLKTYKAHRRVRNSKNQCQAILGFSGGIGNTKW